MKNPKRSVQMPLQVNAEALTLAGLRHKGKQRKRLNSSLNKSLTPKGSVSFPVFLCYTCLNGHRALQDGDKGGCMYCGSQFSHITVEPARNYV